LTAVNLYRIPTFNLVLGLLAFETVEIRAGRRRQLHPTPMLKPKSRDFFRVPVKK
jgi:hypothetical protein